MPRVIFVVAHDRCGIMGKSGRLPWHLPEDLKHFRRLTLEKPVIMGRVTFDSIGKPLVRRRNIVLTRDRSFQASGVEVASSLDEAFKLCADANEIAIIGGAQIFNVFSPYVDTAYVTRVEAEIEGDVRYSEPNRPHTIETIGAYPADEMNAYAMTFLRYEYDVTDGSRNVSNPSR